MSGKDQETAAELTRIRAEWERLEAWRATLETEARDWRAELLAAGDRIGLGGRLRGLAGSEKPHRKSC